VAGDQPGRYRIASHRHDNGDGLRHLRGGQCPGRPRGHNDIDFQADKVGDQSGEALILSLCPSVLDHNVLVLHIAALAQAMPESLHEVGF
jgi:hypothetical protein